MLRKLQEKDANRMLEWMHDSEVNCNFRFDFAAMTREKALDFIAHSFSAENQHFAIVDSADNYLGTISLKNITKTDAEYAIVLRKESWGGGDIRISPLQKFSITHLKNSNCRKFI